MGTFKKEKRTISHKFRVTEQEEIQIRRDMANADYLSMSKYFRDVILRRKIVLERKDLGVNYNQAVRALHGALNARGKDGEPLLKGKAAAYFLAQLVSLSDEIIRRQEDIIDRVSGLPPRTGNK